MNNFDVTRLGITLLVVVVILLYSYKKLFTKNNAITTKFISRTAIFAAIATILYVVPYLKFPVPFFPSFLELHFDEVPIFIAGFAYGPLSAFFIIVIRTIIKLPMTSTLGVGELADLIYSIVFIIPACLIYKNKRTIKGALFALLVGMILQLITSTLLTTYVILDFYIYVMGFSKDAILQMCQSINPNVTSLGWPFALFVALPFNAFKDGIVVALTFILYKRLKILIEKMSK